MSTLILTSPSKEKAVAALNRHFYSTTYDINDQNQITWKGGEVKDNLELKILKGRYRISQK